MKRYSDSRLMSMTTVKYDLHCHSYYSDGTLSPTELIRHAVDCGISHLALTDHDTLSGLPEAKAATLDKPIELINGVEFSASWNGQLIHIVGLNIEPEESTLLGGIEHNRDLRLQRAEKMFVDFEKHDIDLRDEVNALLKEGGVPTRPHFADALIAAGKAKDKKQAFKRYLVRGKPGFIPMQWPELEVVANWIIAGGGVPVLAHPLRYKFTRSKLVRLIKDMLAVGMRGIEVATCSNDPQQIEMLASLVRQHDLLASVGSDFHSPDQPWARLGTAPGFADDLNTVWSQF